MQTPGARILIDVGISARGIASTLASLGTAPEELTAICITHEHTDHIRALKLFSERWQIPIICNRETAKAICAAFPTHRGFNFKLFSTGEPFAFSDLEITPFRVQHDAVEPVGFRFGCNGRSVAVCTDLGIWTRPIAEMLKGAEALLIEANHEPDFVYASPRSKVYKERVTGRFGHLSNSECADLIRAAHTPQLKRVYLGHLSSECNSPDKARAVIEERTKALDLEIMIAAQNERAPVYISSERAAECARVPERAEAKPPLQVP